MKKALFLLVIFSAFFASKINAQCSSDTIKVLVMKFDRDSIGNFYDQDKISQKLGVSKYDLSDKITETIISGFKKYEPELVVQVINIEKSADIFDKSQLVSLCNSNKACFMVVLNKMSFEWEGEPFNYYFNKIDYTLLSENGLSRNEFDFVSTDILHISKIQKKTSKLSKQIYSELKKATPVSEKLVELTLK